MAWGAILAGAGAIAGGVANANSARRQNRAVQAQNDFQSTQYAQYGARRAGLAYGADASRYLAGSQTGEEAGRTFQVSSVDRAGVEQQIAALQQAIAERTAANATNSRRRQGWMASNGGRADIDPEISRLTNQLTGLRAQLADNDLKINREAFDQSAAMSPVANMEQNAAQFNDQLRASEAGFEADARESRGLLDNYGRSEGTRIDRESARALQGTQRATRSTLARGGMGLSSYAPTMYAENANSAGEARNDARGQLADRVAGAKVNLRTAQTGQRTALMTANAGQRYQANDNIQRTKLNLLTDEASTPWLNKTPGAAAASPGSAFVNTVAGQMSAMGGLYGLASAGQGSGSAPGGSQFEIDQSYSTGSTLSGSNRPR
jgi:hypothetical protein